jgi:Zn-dependent protease
LVVGRLAGAPIIITPSWFVAAVVLTLIFSRSVNGLAPGLPTSSVLLVAFVFVLLLFVSVFCHEAAHALVARACGYRVTELAMTLWGGHTAYTGKVERPGDGALVAVVGPITNLVLAAVAGFGLWLAQGVTVWGVWFGDARVGSLGLWLVMAAGFTNVFVGVFNLLPGLPLDGGQILEALVWKLTGSHRTGTTAAGWIGRIVAAGVVVFFLLLPLVRGNTPSITSVVWAAIIGAFLWQGAGEAIKNAARREVIDGLVARDIMGPAIAVVRGTSLAEAMGRVTGIANAAVVVTDEIGTPFGWVDPAAASAVPAEAVWHTRVDAALVPFPPASAVEASASGAELVEHLRVTSGGARFVPVVERGRVVGVLDIAQVVAMLRRPAAGQAPRTGR